MTHPLDASTSTRTRTQPIIPQIQHTPTSPTIIDITNPSNTSPSSHQPNSTQTSNGIPPSSTADTLAPVMPEKFDRFESPAGAYPTGRSEGWEEAFEAQRLKRWEEKVTGDLKRWRGGNGIPRSEYSREAVPTNSYYGQPVTGTIGQHLPKEIVRIERDWSGGEVCQFESVYPMELEGRISPEQWSTFIEQVNNHLISAYSVNGAVVDNLIAIMTWWTSLLWRSSHFEKELKTVERIIRNANKELFNPAGLHMLSPRGFALQYLEIEYY